MMLKKQMMVGGNEAWSEAVHSLATVKPSSMIGFEPDNTPLNRNTHDNEKSIRWHVWGEWSLVRSLLRRAKPLQKKASSQPTIPLNTTLLKLWETLPSTLMYLYKYESVWGFKEVSLLALRRETHIPTPTDFKPFIITYIFFLLVNKMLIPN